jgi:4-hydroxy-3-methylbut-2-en-1-yl diphosphate synthase IspG/GcpE
LTIVDRQQPLFNLEGGANMTAKTTKLLTCPSCGESDIDLLNYDSLMVLKPLLGLFTISCPHCSVKISTILPIPEELQPEIAYVAKEVDAGMGE